MDHPRYYLTTETMPALCIENKNTSIVSVYSYTDRYENGYVNYVIDVLPNIIQERMLCFKAIMK